MRPAGAAAAALLLIAAAPAAVSERERFEAEQAVKQRELAVAEGDLALRRAAAEESRWTSPLVLAVLAAAIAAAGNAAVAYLNGGQQRRLEETRAGANRELEREKAEAQIELEREKAAAQRALDEQESESARILEVIKTGDTERAAGNMQFLVDAGLVTKPDLVEKLSQYLATRAVGQGPALPPADGAFSFKDSADLTPATQAALSDTLGSFLAYLDKVGFARDEGPIAIEVRDFDNAHYEPERRTMVLGVKLRDDPDVARHEYMHHALATAGAKYRDEPHYLAIESALADYYPCSFSGDPTVAAIAARNLGLDPPWLRHLTSAKGYADLAGDLEHHSAGEIWGSLFWDLRAQIGAPAADRLLLHAWAGCTWPKGGDKAARGFIAGMRGAAQDPLVRERVDAVLTRRGYPLVRPRRA